MWFYSERSAVCEVMWGLAEWENTETANKEAHIQQIFLLACWVYQLHVQHSVFRLYMCFQTCIVLHSSRRSPADAFRKKKKKRNPGLSQPAITAQQTMAHLCNSEKSWRAPTEPETASSFFSPRWEKLPCVENRGTPSLHMLHGFLFYCLLHAPVVVGLHVLPASLSAGSPSSSHTPNTCSLWL